MHVVWKRPDGFHSASPEDFRIAEINPTARIWLHKKDQENYPFRVSGGWQDKDATEKINCWINLIGQPSNLWLEKLQHEYNNSEVSKPETFIHELLLWLNELKKVSKGDSWEQDIMHQAFEKATEQIKKIKGKIK